ncbi:MAG: tetratricopeptide repeat protein [Opitutales bacterium]|nr:tetratricopeptide repeat protein [Opitutales bacterium]
MLQDLQKDTKEEQESGEKTIKLAEAGDADAQVELGEMHLGREFIWALGEIGVPEEALKWFLKAAEQGNAEAQNYLGIMYYNGLGVPEKKGKSARWFLKAAKQGIAEAQYYLGLMYHDGEGVLQDFEQAVKWYTKAPSKGLPKLSYISVLFTMTTFRRTPKPICGSILLRPMGLMLV